MKTISIDEKQFKEVKERIKVKVQNKEKSLNERKERMIEKIERFEKAIAKAEDKLFEDLIDSETFKNSKRRYIDKINKCHSKLLKLKHFNRVFEFQNRVEKARKYIDLPGKFSDANFEEKRALLDSILKKKISLFS